MLKIRDQSVVQLPIGQEGSVTDHWHAAIIYVRESATKEGEAPAPKQK